MRKSFLALAGALIGGAMLASPSKAAVVHVTDLGLTPIGSTHYVGVTGQNSFSDYFMFQIASPLMNASVSFSDTVTAAANKIVGGTLDLYSCATNCGASASVSQLPTGTLIDSAALVNFASTVQFAAIDNVSLATAGYYFLKLTGTAPHTGVTYDGTISLSSAVPEPATWAMMLAGFGGLAFAGMRRRKTIGAAV